MTLNQMHDLSIIHIKEQRYWMPQWQVELCHGTPGGAGIMTDIIHVTKKWERVEAAIEELKQKSMTYPQHERGEWYVIVTELAQVAKGTYTFPQSSEELIDQIWEKYEYSTMHDVQSPST
jgi:hypothetical protein